VTEQTATEPAEVSDEQIYDYLKEYQEAGMIEYVLPTEPLGVQWIVGHDGQILKFLSKEGIVGFLIGIKVCADYVARSRKAASGPIWDDPAWGSTARQAAAERQSSTTEELR
jgi:hypothetical protein